MKTHNPILILSAVFFGIGCLSKLAAQTNSQTPTASTTEATPPPSAPALRSAAELEKLVLPIALHPDPLIAILLPASVYPLEIVQAARFVKDTNNMAKVDEQQWDENVKAVAKFPDLIAKMDADLPWTVELGQAFLDQPKELMDTIQALRGKAHKAGTLQNSPQQVVTVTNVVVVQTNVTQVVTVTNQIVQVQPSNPEVIYVPSYPPTVYYPPPAYVYNPVAPLVTFGVGMAWGAILANNCNWGHGEIDIDVDHNYNVDRDVNRNTDRNVNRSSTQSANRTSTSGKQKWQPDQSRINKSGAPAASASSREARGYSGSSGTTRPTTGTAGSRPTTGTAGSRPTTGTAGSRPTTGTAPSGSRPSSGNTSSSRPSSSQAASPSRSSGGSSSAFGGVNSGSAARSQSSRGSGSRGGGGGRGGGGRGR